MNNNKTVYVYAQSEITYFLIVVDSCVVLTFNVYYVYFKLYIFAVFF